MKARLLVVEDDVLLAETLSEEFAPEYEVEVVGTMRKAEDRAMEGKFDLIILDLALPDGWGLDLCKELRQNGVVTPILMLTGDGQVSRKVRALVLGADDYVTKPFYLPELKARMEAIRRRSNGKGRERLVWGDLSIDLLSMEVKRKERQIPLNRKEFYLLKYLLEHAGMVVRRDAIMDEVWGETAEVRSNTLEVHVKRLRRKLDEPFSSHMIQTVHGVGYKLALDE